MNIVVQMMIRNEVDIITETLASIVGWGLKTIVILDAGSDDGTLEAVDEFSHANPSVELDLYVQPDPCDQFADHQRNILLEMSSKYNPDWEISLDADEIYHTNPVEAILEAEKNGAKYIRSLVPQFWITYADLRDGLLIEDESFPIQERRRWYSWGHTGVFMWKRNPDHYYPRGEQKRTPVVRYSERLIHNAPTSYGPVYPICKHYCFRSLRQGLRRTDERLRRGGVKYFGKYMLDWIIDEAAVGLTKFDGTNWNTTPNHEQLKAWMDRFDKEKRARRLEWALSLCPSD